MEFNPHFMTDGELVLRTCDRVCFRVHAITLKHSSSVFTSMLNIPLGETPANEPILLQDDSTSVEFMLRCISPNATLPFDQDLCFSEIKDITAMADKYDMPRVLDFARLYTTIHWDKVLSTASALELFGLSCRWKWKDLVWKSSQETLKIKLHSTVNLPVMKTCLRENELYALLQLHWARKELLSRLSFEGRTFSVFKTARHPRTDPRMSVLADNRLETQPWKPIANLLNFAEQWTTTLKTIRWGPTCSLNAFGLYTRVAYVILGAGLAEDRFTTLTTLGKGWRPTTFIHRANRSMESDSMTFDSARIRYITIANVNE